MGSIVTFESKEVLAAQGICPNTGNTCNKLCEIRDAREAFRVRQDSLSAGGSLPDTDSDEAKKAIDEMVRRTNSIAQVLGGECLDGCKILD